jgi:hypothetical protein
MYKQESRPSPRQWLGNTSSCHSCGGRLKVRQVLISVRWHFVHEHRCLHRVTASKAQPRGAILLSSRCRGRTSCSLTARRSGAHLSRETQRCSLSTQGRQPFSSLH